MAQQIERTLDILELLVDEARGLALGEFALRLGMPKSAAHRLLAELVDQGYVLQDPASQHYKLTMRLAVLGFRFLNNSGLTDVCQPVLDDLAEKSGELVRLTVVDGDNLVWVAEAQGARYGLRYDGNFGRRVNLSATATGKCWLATLDEDEAIGIVLNQGFGDPSEVGPNAIRSAKNLIEELAKTRSQGYAVACDEGEPGMSALAAAIRISENAGCVGTVSIAGPTIRLTPDIQEHLAPSVIEAASSLSSLWPARMLQPEIRRQTRDLVARAGS